MEASNKLAWAWGIKEGCLEEYMNMHLVPWQEILQEHNKAGIRNYSIFQNAPQFFYCFECDDVNNSEHLFLSSVNKDRLC
jgi:L-rhamnose mutarotase